MTATNSNSDNVGTYSYPLAMNRLTASLGINQLKKQTLSLIKESISLRA